MPLLPTAMKEIGEAWEVVYVNDGSRDSSLKLLTELQAKDAHVVVVDLSRNWGHMGAISAGLQTARGDAVVLMDGDFQDPPEVVPELVAAWRGGAQVVTAVTKKPARTAQGSSQAVSALLSRAGSAFRLSHPAQRGNFRPSRSTSGRLD